MKIKGKILYSFVCAMLFVMTFTMTMSFAATGDIINPIYLGTYDNTDNSVSWFSISTDTPGYPIYATTVYASDREFYIRGRGETVVIGYGEFGANFEKVRKVNKQGQQQGEDWWKNVVVVGSYSVTGLFNKKITITTYGDNNTYVKR